MFVNGTHSRFKIVMQHEAIYVAFARMLCLDFDASVSILSYESLIIILC